jgi:hypothetical protein
VPGIVAFMNSDIEPQFFSLFFGFVRTQSMPGPLKLKKNKAPHSDMHAEVVTRVASSLGAGGLPGYPECLFVEINVMKS